MFTTGAVTEKNYTDSKAGKKGEFHHTFGFVIVEIKDKDTFFIRHVTATKNGDFCDLIYKITDEGVSFIEGISAAILGDIHCGQMCKKTHEAQKKWLSAVKPKHTVLHDVFDGYSINHHEEDDPIRQYEKHTLGTDNLLEEISNMLLWLDTMKEYNCIIPSANHNDFVDRWIKRVNWKYHIKNAKEYMEYAQVLMSGKAKEGIISYLINQKFGKKIKTLGRNDLFPVKGCELANHGDKGPNGSRGSAQSYRKLNVKMINGHSHTPSRLDGCITVGTTSILRQRYIIGPSSHLPCDAWIHEDGKAQQLIYFDGEFTTIKFNGFTC